MVSAAQILSRRETLRQRVSLGSPTGRQIERLRNRLGPPEHSRPDGIERMYVALVDAERAHDQITAHLTEDERQVWALRYSIHGSEVYQRTVWESEVRRIQLDGDELPTMMTSDGEEVCGSARDEDGQVVPGRVVVRGRRGRLLSFEEIGERLGLTPRQVRSRYDSASKKVRQAMSEREHRLSLDSD